jgi:hypothetical protein
MVLNSEQLEKNALTLLKKSPNAKTMLKKADGKKDYHQIAKELGIHEKIVSPALTLAKDLGFAIRIRPGVYKKITSNMKYIPNTKKMAEKTEVMGDIMRKLSKKARNKSNLIEQGYSFRDRNKVEKMANAYRWLFITENILRDLIRNVLKKDCPNWWEERVPDDIKKEVNKMMQNSKYDDPKRKDNLEYTHLGQLKDIIIYKRNWKDFEPFLKSKDKNNFDVDINRVIPSRNAIGHCISLIGDDYTYAEMRFKAILKLLK